VVRPGAGNAAEPAYDEDYFRIDKDSVVVGVPDDTCGPAVEAAFAAAARRDARVHAVHAWSFPELPAYGLASQFAPTAEAIRSCEENGEAVLAQAVDPVAERYPEVDLSLSVVNGPRAKVMVDASRDATMVVVATHRRPGRIGRQLGPVTHALLHHAHAPVLLVPVD
jgi:nucleotide-binding universal stress UspA family protein